MKNNFNPDMLILAREFREYSQSELSDLSGIDNANLSRFEGGIRTPLESDIERLSRALNVPVSYFERDGKRRQVETGELFYRRKANVTMKVRRRIEATLNLLRLNLERLLEIADIEYPFKIPVIQPSEITGGPEEIARAVRYAWRIPNGPIEHLIGALENAGCFIFALDFQTAEIDAVSHWIEPSPPIVLLNSRAPSDRIRFSLAHELGHLVMHHIQTPTNDMEDEANDFGSAFLLPPEEFAESAVPVTLERIFQMKPYWKTSGQAMLMRAKMLRLITKEQFVGFMKSLGSLGYRTLEPFAIPPERPALMSKVLDLYRSELGYTNTELMELITMSEADFNAMYLGSHAPQLRIIPHHRKRTLSSGNIQGA